MMKDEYGLYEFVKDNEGLILKTIQELHVEMEGDEPEESDYYPKVFGYTRVSSKSQADNYSLAFQKNTILDKYPSAEIHSEVISGVANIETLSYIVENMIAGDILAVSTLDRFSRNVLLGTCFFEKIVSKGCYLDVINVRKLGRDPSDKLTFLNLLTIAEYDRLLTHERTNNGKIEARKNKNYKEGRPKKYNDKELFNAFGLLSCMSYKEVSAYTGISVSTLSRFKRNYDDMISQNKSMESDIISSDYI